MSNAVLERRNCGCRKCEVVFRLRQHEADSEADDWEKQDDVDEYMKGFDIGVCRSPLWTLPLCASERLREGFSFGRRCAQDCRDRAKYSGHEASSSQPVN